MDIIRSRYIGISSDYWRSFQFVSANESFEVRYYNLQSIVRKLQKLIPRNVITRKFDQYYRAFNSQENQTSAAEDQETLQFLDDYFKDDCLKLQKLTGVNFTRWFTLRGEL